MKKNSRYYLTSIALILIIGTSYGQSTKTEGHLLRFDISKKAFAFEDSLFNWIINANTLFYSHSYYNGGFTFNSKDYFIKHAASSGRYYQGTDQLLFNNNEQLIGSLYSYYGEMDIIGPYEFEITKAVVVDKGVWLLSGELSNFFLNNNDSLLAVYEPFIHISGKLGDQYLVTKSIDVFSKLDHFLADLSSSPVINYNRQIAIDSKDSSEIIAPQKIASVSDNKYILEIPNALYLCSYSDLKLTLDKKLFTAEYKFDEDWVYVNGFLYFRDGLNLIKTKIDTVNNSTIDSTILLSGIYAGFDISPNNDFIVAEIRDTLFIYSTKDDCFYLKYDLSRIKYSSGNIVTTDNNVYLHTVDMITGVYDEETIPSTSFSLSQNYPNPFNPSTTISYKLSSAGHVTLKVYDMIGREIATLVNEEKIPGNYEVIFDASNSERSRGMASGVYFYRLQTGNFSETKKFVLMK